MARDPFDEFRKIEKLFQKMLGTGDFLIGGTSRGISVQKMGDKTRVDVHGNISESELERLREKYPDAEVSVNGETIERSGPVEVLDEEDWQRGGYGDGFEDAEGPKIEEIDGEEIDSQELALKRFKERKREESKD